MARAYTQSWSPRSLDAFVLFAAHSAQQARDAIRELESTLTQTRDRVEQSRRKLAASDLLIDDLSNLICQSSPQQPRHP
ncbi:hypothetical protein [Occallatibacter riparius]|uniref:Uncharacterized protein n=1 Tax=Occallatibacter riparius TaxID=1002689 RepID=A0A9J7BTL1_9BACT|nr:hypothetical protein [Occallatibacter riparius]UWZ86212.1 hypothetical protein MOP44_09760 [Occallatibacter riparius]